MTNKSPLQPTVLLRSPTTNNGPNALEEVLPSTKATCQCSVCNAIGNYLCKCPTIPQKGKFRQVLSTVLAIGVDKTFITLFSQLIVYSLHYYLLTHYCERQQQQEEESKKKQTLIVHNKLTFCQQ
jgi:hypothetical protein